jgi:hypothetical protein
MNCFHVRFSSRSGAGSIPSLIADAIHRDDKLERCREHRASPCRFTRAVFGRVPSVVEKGFDASPDEQFLL